MALVAQPMPSGDLLSIYAPISYELTAAFAFGKPPIIKAQLYINGATYGREITQPHYVISGDFKFRFDVSELLRTYAKNEDTFNLGANTNVQPTADASNAGFAKRCTFYVVFVVWEGSGVNGIYEHTAITYTSNSLLGLNIAANQYLDEQSIEYFGGALPTRFLTNAPMRQSMALNEKLFLSYFNRGNSREGMRVQTFNSTGALMATVYYDIGQALNNAMRVRRLAVGTTDIALLTSLVGVHYYTICIVEDTTIPVPFVFTEIREFFITKGECSKYSLLFLNALGADDVIRFKDFQFTNTIEKEVYTANNPNYPTASARGLTVLNSRGSRKITLAKFGVVNRLLPWYYELQNTSVAYLQKAGESTLIAIAIEKVSDFEAEGTAQTVRDIEVECALANIDYSHSN
jgi:hypothetical protein